MNNEQATLPHEFATNRTMGLPMSDPRNGGLPRMAIAEVRDLLRATEAVGAMPSDGYPVQAFQKITREINRERKKTKPAVSMTQRQLDTGYAGSGRRNRS